MDNLTSPATKQDILDAVQALSVSTKEDINAVIVANKQDIADLAATNKRDIDAMIAANKRDLDAVIVANRQEIQTSLKTFDTKFDRLNSKIDDLAISTKKDIQEVIEVVNDFSVALDQRMDNMDRRFDYLDRRMDSLDNRLDDHKHHITTLVDVLTDKDVINPKDAKNVLSLRAA